MDTDQSKKSVVNVFIAEFAEAGTFGRVNFIGCNLSDEISIPSVPYAFRANAVLIADITAPVAPASVKVTFTIYAMDGSTLELYSESGNKETESGPFDLKRTSWRIINIIPFDFKLPCFGRLKMNIEFPGVSAETTWNIVQGEAAFTGQGAPAKASGVISASDPFDWASLLKSAIKSIDIQDPYLELPLLPLLSKLSNSGIKIRIVTDEGRPKKNGTKPRRSAIETEKKSLMAKFQNLNVRFSNTFHDRLIIIDGTEVFAFGHSFKDMNAGRISRFAKVSDKNEHDDFMREFENDWTQGSQWQ